MLMLFRNRTDYDANGKLPSVRRELFCLAFVYPLAETNDRFFSEICVVLTWLQLVQMILTL
jgi:hypothetical protein